ncbi:MAG: hypothetical protein H6822_00005 [Planctomycetaceae bacterium]|nr:hypothetical protein [Planctomycetaceae bacterium]
MTPEDETELYRLSDMLSQIDATLPDTSPLREALQKSGLAIIYAFRDGRRFDIETDFDGIGKQLTDLQREHLRSMGIDPDVDRVE